MDGLTTAFPELAAKLVDLLHERGRQDLLDQIHHILVSKVTYDNAADAGYIYLRSGKTPNIVDERIISTRLGETICVNLDESIILDIDNLGNLEGIELLSPPSRWKSELRRCAAP